MAVTVEDPGSARGLVFIVHGLGGFKEQPHIQMMANVFLRNGCRVVRYDATNSLGESAGSYQYATVTNYYNDLEDVINWSQTQPWYQEPFMLAAHNLGGMCASLYAARHPQSVRALAPIATLVSGELSLQALQAREDVAMWQATGWLVRESRSRPGIMKRLKWSHMEDRMRYDLLAYARFLTMPVCLAVGDSDFITPPAHQQKLFDALPGPKELYVIPNAGHRFRDVIYLRELEKILDHWAWRMVTG